MGGGGLRGHKWIEGSDLLLGGGVYFGVRGGLLDVDVDNRSKMRGGTGGTGGTSSGTDTDVRRILPSRFRTMVLNSDMGRSLENEVPSSTFDWALRRRRVRSSTLNA